MASVSLLYRSLVAASWRHFPHVQRSGTSKPISNTWAPLAPLVSSNRYVIEKIQFDFNIDCAHRHDSAE